MHGSRAQSASPEPGTRIGRLEGVRGVCDTFACFVVVREVVVMTMELGMDIAVSEEAVEAK